MTRKDVILVTLAALLWGSSALGQTSSLGAKQRRLEASRAPKVVPREAPVRERNRVYERYSWVTLTPAPPKKFEPGDLLTIVVRERRKYEADADLETKKEFDAKSELNAFIKGTAGGIGAAAFRRGKPTIDYKFQNTLKHEGDTNREDRLTTRLTASIIDVKPNGLLVLEAISRIQHDDEISTITLTGNCRKEDVTPDNTILSTQIADKRVTVSNEGALRAASRRGWIPRLLDFLRPF
ncbi:MAG: flagellar basal body L-ring protein FlgH [Phycisphaerales bacterium]|nr:MAG: flagellar basal body L-ring protein FlgH [Phycisphaerales bacterium]